MQKNYEESLTNGKRLSMNSLISSRPCGSFLRPTLAAVNWPVWIRFERNFTFLTAFRASCLVHLFCCHGLFSTPYTCLWWQEFVSYAPNLCTWTKHIKLIMNSKDTFPVKAKTSLMPVLSARYSCHRFISWKDLSQWSQTNLPTGSISWLSIAGVA